MKKQIVTACALIASVAAFATSVESSNTFGVLKIAAPEGQSIIPVPWEKVGGGDIVVTDYVLPTGLADDDLLYWYDANIGAYKVWKIDNGAWAVDTTIQIDVTGVTKQESTLADTLARGTAAILQLNAAADVYLSGQYSTETAITPVYGLNSGEHATFPMKFKTTMIAAPVAEEYSPNEKATYGTTNDNGSLSGTPTMAGDKLVVISSTGETSTYTYYADTTKTTSAGWYKKTTDKGYVAAKIPAGAGAWYMRYNDGNIYIKW